MSEAQVAVIGGSGFYDLDGLIDVEELRLDTPFGPPSDALMLGTLAGVRVAFLPRHGVGHRILPSELPSRANIWVLKSIGVEWVISVSAVGSLREDFEPLHAVVPDQLIDRTRARPNTFFGDGIVAHISFDQPFCPAMSKALAASAGSTGATVHGSGTYVVMEGPAFSTKAESSLYRSWGAGIIGMTALPEAKLAREAELCYATLALVTDYDVWHESHDPVTADMIIQNLNRNVAMAKRAVANTIGSLPSRTDCTCSQALASALITSPELVPSETKERLGPIIGRYMPVEAAV
jgi:5'-methylthioadenosine phosphorylase